MIITAEGIVLRQRKIANNRRMIVLSTKQYGKISAGTSVNEKSRSRAALALRPFTFAEYDIFKGREAYSINSAQVRKSFFTIGEDIDRFMNASAFIEYLDKVLGEGEAMPKLFELSLEFLQTVSESRSGSDTLLFAFIVKSLRLLGVAPELDCCVNCGRSAEALGQGFRKFSVSGGGIICDDCAAEEKTEPDSLIYSPGFNIIDVFRYFESKPISAFGKIALRPAVKKEMRDILAEYTGRYLGADVLSDPKGLEV